MCSPTVRAAHAQGITANTPLAVRGEPELKQVDEAVKLHVQALGKQERLRAEASDVRPRWDRLPSRANLRNRRARRSKRLTALGVNKFLAVLAVLGQPSRIWAGGGTIVVVGFGAAIVTFAPAMPARKAFLLGLARRVVIVFAQANTP